MHIALHALHFVAPGHGGRILDRVDLEVPAGECVALMGPSGCGKSTILELIVGYYTPSDGKVLCKSDSETRSNCSHDATFLPQDALDLILPWRTCLDNVLLVQSVGVGARQPQALSAADLLERVKLSDARRKFPLALSGGEQRRLALAMALARSSSVLLLDEPITGVDFDIRIALWDLIWSCSRRGDKRPSVLLVTHSPEDAAVLCDRAVFLCRTARGAVIGAEIRNSLGREESMAVAPSRRHKSREATAFAERCRDLIQQTT